LDLSEFLGRAGVSLLKAGATAAIGGALAAVFGGLLLTIGAPMLLVAGVVVLGYIAAATLLDLVDGAFEIKERVAVAAR
jgi:ascorbate-specific PTS system EIIC-type component UlaA